MGCYEAPESGSRYRQRKEKEVAHAQDSCRTSCVEPIIEKKTGTMLEFIVAKVIVSSTKRSCIKK